MTFEGLVDRLRSLFDVTQARAVDVANERLSEMVTRSTALRATTTLGTTTSGTASYTLASNIVKIIKAEIPYTNGTVEYDGNATIGDLWDVAAGNSEITGNVIVVEPDADESVTTDRFRLYPTPAESGKAITGLVALRPATLTYTSNTPLPIPVDLHPKLLAGCKAELYEEEGNSGEAALQQAEFEQGIRLLEAGVNKRGKGSSGSRLRLVGYDYARR